MTNMKLLATLGTVLLSLAPDSVYASDGDAGSLLRSRKLQGNKNVFTGNTKDFKSDTGIVGSFLKPPPPGNVAEPEKLKNLILGALGDCVDDWVSLGVEVEKEHVSCDVYFNPHTSKFMY